MRVLLTAGRLRRGLARAPWVRDGSSVVDVAVGAVDTIRSISVECARRAVGAIGHAALVGRTNRHLATRVVSRDRRLIGGIGIDPAGVKGRDLGRDAATIGCVANRGKMRADQVDEALLHVVGAVVKGRLVDIVGI